MLMRVFPYNLSVFLALFSLAILGNVRAVPFPDPWRSDRIAGSAHRIWTRGARSAREGPRKLGPNEHQIWPQNVCPVALDPGVLGLWKTCKNFTFVTFERLRAPATPGRTIPLLWPPLEHDLATLFGSILEGSWGLRGFSLGPNLAPKRPLWAPFGTESGPTQSTSNV